MCKIVICSFYLLVVCELHFGLLVGTGFLWWTFYQEHTAHNENSKMTIPVLHIQVQNERAFLVFSIIASVLTVGSVGHCVIE